jgi:hypothetical protein
LREAVDLVDVGVDGRIFKWIFKKCDGSAWAGLIWLRIGNVAGSCRWGIRTMRRISRLAEELLASQEEFCSMELFS